MATFSADEVAGFLTLGDIITFVGLSEPLKAGFLDATGGTVDSLPRAFGIVPEADYKIIIEDVRVKMPDAEPRAMKFAEKASLLLIGEACRATAGMASGPPSGSLAPASGPPPTVSVSVQKVKLSQVLRQGDDTDLEVLPQAAMVVGFGRWEAYFGLERRPAEEAEITIEQFTCMKHLLESERVPYADFAIWGPFGHRTERKLRIAGQLLQADGTFRSVEIAGPPTLEVWCQSWDVLQTAYVFLDVLNLGTMVEYKKMICDYHAQYGPACWLLIYQTEIRFRLEHVERVRRLCMSQHQKAITAKGTTAFEPDKPWKFS